MRDGIRRGNNGFGLRNRTAIACAASMGLGKASAIALGTEGVKLVVVARRREILERAADEIRSVTGADTVAVAADVTTQEGRDAILAACPDPDILINNAGGPPSGDFRNWDRGDWIKALDANMLAPIELMKSTIDGMIAQVRPDPGRRLWTASQRANCKTVHIDSILVLA